MLDKLKKIRPKTCFIIAGILPIFGFMFMFQYLPNQNLLWNALNRDVRIGLEDRRTMSEVIDCLNSPDCRKPFAIRFPYKWTIILSLVFLLLGFYNQKRD